MSLPNSSLFFLLLFKSMPLNFHSEFVLDFFFFFDVKFFLDSSLWCKRGEKEEKAASTDPNSLLLQYFESARTGLVTVESVLVTVAKYGYDFTVPFVQQRWQLILDGTVETIHRRYHRGSFALQHIGSVSASTGLGSNCTVAKWLPLLLSSSLLRNDSDSDCVSINPWVSRYPLILVFKPFCKRQTSTHLCCITYRARIPDILPLTTQAIDYSTFV